MKIGIENAVVSVTYEGTRFDLEKLAKKLNTSYDPESFSGVVYRLEHPRASFLIFASGKANCVGAKSVGGARLAVRRLTRKLRRSGVGIRSEPKVRVQNIVAAIDFGRGFDLDEIARRFEDAEYEPEVFPGLVFRLDDPKVVVLLFASGKGICAGAKNRRDIERAARMMVRMGLPG